MILINNINEQTFSLNGINYTKNFVAIKTGEESLMITNLYDTKFQLLAPTKYNEITVNGTLYTNVTLLMNGLTSILFYKKNVQDIPYLGSIVPTSAAYTGSTAAFWTATQAGTYTNYGSVVVSGNSFATISRNTSGAFSISQTPLTLTDYETKINRTAYSCFSPYKNISQSTLSNTFSTKSRSDVYKAFKTLKLYGFNSNNPHKINHIWNDAYQSTGHHYFRLIIQEYVASAWTTVFDSGSLVEMSDIGFVNDQVCSYTWDYKGKKVSAEIDLSYIPIDYTTIAFSTSDPEMIIAEKCFVDDNSLIPNVWKSYRLLTAPNTLNSAFGTSTRREMYQAVNSIKLYGFDIKDNLSIQHLWNSYTLSGTSYFRLILAKWDATTSAYTRTFDSGASKTMSEYGLVSAGTQTIDISDTSNGTRVVAELNFDKIAVGSNAALNTIAPDFIFDKSVYFDSGTNGSLSLEIFNANKMRYNSRRKATISMIFDDLNSSDSTVYSIFREYNFLPSFALKTNVLNSTSVLPYINYYMKGCSILSHSVTHPSMSTTGITYSNVDNEMTNSKKAIEAYGIKVNGWVTPQSVLHNSFFPLMVKNYGYGFTQLNSGLFNSSVDPLKLDRYGIEGNIGTTSAHSLTTIFSRIDTAIANNELLVMYGHQIPSTYVDDNGNSRVNATDLRSILAYIKTKSDDNQCLMLPADEAIYEYYKTPFI